MGLFAAIGSILLGVTSLKSLSDSSKAARAQRRAAQAIELENLKLEVQKEEAKLEQSKQELAAQRRERAVKERQAKMKAYEKNKPKNKGGTLLTKSQATGRKTELTKRNTALGTSGNTLLGKEMS